MRKVILLALVFLTSFTAFGQDFSNKGTEFWTCFPNHIPSGSNGQMTIWITSDQASSGVVSITNGSFSAPFSVAANGIVPINIPYANAHISNAESGTVIQKSIKIKVNAGQPAVVAYAQQYGNARSAATLLLPTNVLGKKYRAFSFTHTPTSAGGQNSRSQFQIIATQPNTQVEVTPILNGIKSATFTIVFPNVGDMYQYQASADVTGTLIESIATGSGSCLPIAVFSGNSAVTIGTPTCNGNSYDPLFQQCYPITTWGKNYGFIPFGDYTSTGNPYRVMASEDNTIVSFNGGVVATLNAGEIYPAGYTSNPVLLNQPTLITADKPISVAHYLQTSACSGSNNGDPDMVLLNPIEQNIKDITVFASTQQNITRQWINVLIPTVAAPSFRIDGFAPTTAFVPAPNIPGYSFLRHMFNPAINGSHYLTADSGFNAVLYGYQGGNFESYAYSAGTNVRDLSQQLELQTTYGIESSPSVCTTAPFVFKVYFPDSTLGTPPVAIRFDSLKWDISNPALIVPSNFPIMYHGTVGTPPTVAIDSTNIRNGRKVNWYSLPTTYYFNAAGYDSLLVTGYSSTNEGCGSTREYIFSVQISDPPTASFTTNTPGCYLIPVTATETTPQIPKATYHQWWEFFDPVSNTRTVYTGNGIRTPSHTFTSPGIKTIRHASITTPGCLSDTIVHTVNLPDLPNATISGNTTPVCINSAVGPNVVFTGTLGTPEYIFTYRINGGAPITSFASTGGVLTIQAPTNASGTFIYELLSVQNQGAAVCTRPISGQTVTVTITPDATVTLRPGDNDNQTVCINNPIVNIRYDIGGSGNGGTVTGLPAGVNGTYAGGVVTITGTPTSAVGSPFTYTIVPTGPCAFPIPAITGRITVNDDATIALTSAAGTDDQTKCINTIIDNIDYLVARGGTGATIAWTPSTPPGISFTPLGGGTFRIAGTPTAAGTFNYTISTAGPCIIPTATGRLIVTPDATVALRPGDNDNQAVCVNNPILNIRYDIGGSGNGGTVTGLPPGVTGTYAGGVVTITGTPTTEIGSPFIYTIVPTGPCAFPVPAITGRITVTGDATLVLSSFVGTDAQELCRNTAITNITYDFGGTATSATVSGLPAGVTWSVTGNRVTITGTPTVSSPVPFTYTVSTAGPCVRPSLTGNILVNALPTASFTYTAPSCETRDIVFTDGSTANVGALDQWTWVFGDPASGPLNTSGSQNPTHVYATPGAYNVTLSVRNDKGCISNPIAAQVININHRPVAGFIVPDVCINDVATLFTDTSKIAVGTINRSLNEWNYGDPASGPLNNSIGINGSHLYPAPGIYNVRQIVTSALGCRDTIILPITINSADPASNFSINNSGTLCSSDSVELVNLSTVGFGNVTRLEIYWDNVGAPGTFQTINAPAFNGVYRHKYLTSATNRNYTIRMIAYSGVICSAQRTTNITVYATPQVQFNTIPDACLLVAPYQITQGSETGGVPGTGTYSGPGITNPNGTFNPQLAGIGTHAIKYTFTASNAGACIDTLTRFITVLDTAHARFSFVTPSCEQVPTSFTDLSTAPPTVIPATTVWDFGDGTGLQTFPAGATFGHIFASPGSYTVRMHTVSAYGCLSTDTTAVVTIDANHAIALTSANSTQTRCINNPIAPINYTLSGGATNVSIANLPPGVTYTVSGGPVITVTISGSPTSATSSPYNFTIQTTGNTCVQANATGRITVDPDHSIALRAGSDTAQSVCINTAIDPIIYDLGGGATGAVVSNLPPGVTHAIAGNILTISGTPTAIPATPGFTITTTGNTCLTAGTIGEIVVHPYPVPAFTVDKPSYCIPNAIVKFTNTSTTPDGSGMTYVWDFGDGAAQSLSISPTHWYTSGIGPFTVRLSATSIAVPVLNGGAQGCNSFVDVVMNSIHPQPKADFVFNKPSVCIGDNVTITDNTDGKDGVVNQWSWDLGDGTTRITNPITHTYADTIAYTITMHSVNNFGCNSDTISKVYNVYPYPHVNAGPDRFVLEGGSILLETVSFANDPTYSWSPAQYLTDSKIARPRVMSPKTDMTYRFTVTGRGGCQLSDDVFVKLLKFPVIPNTFTPNGDGINDTWRIDFLNTYPDNRVQIFTRTGQLVFQSRGYNTPWDGTLKGKPLPFDTYYYIIEPGNGRDPITGYITILK